MLSPFRILKRFAFALLALTILAALVLVGSHLLVMSSARGKLYDKAEAVPEARTALLLGCVKKLSTGYNNGFFWKRINASAELYKAGKVKAFIVSGDNHVHGYDEPTDMKAELVAKGVPADKIYCDYAGFRTLDSIVRAKEVFGQTKLTIISQRFHTERSLYLASCYGIDAIAFNAPDVKLEWALKTYVREAFARVKAVLDTNLLETKPKFLGPKVSLDAPPHDALPPPKTKS